MLYYVMLYYTMYTNKPQDDIGWLYQSAACCPWDDEQCQEAYSAVMTALSEFLSLQFPSRQFETIVLSSCRPDRFSLHIIVPDLVLDTDYLSCRYLSWEFSRFLWKHINTLLMEAEGTDELHGHQVDGLVRLLMLEKQVDQTNNTWSAMNNTPVDEVIYIKNRHFRLVGNGKRGQWLLVPVQSVTDVSCSGK